MLTGVGLLYPVWRSVWRNGRISVLDRTTELSFFGLRRSRFFFDISDANPNICGGSDGVKPELTKV
jgi:hypothetical protein